MDWVKHSEKNPTAVASNANNSSSNNNNNNSGSSSVGSAAGASSSGSGVVAAFAERRLKLVRDKLELRNPPLITCDELSENALRQSKPQVIEKLKEHAMGSKVSFVTKKKKKSSQQKKNKAFNVRARIGEKCSSVAEQVEALVDQATDPNILARFWLGWLSFV
jgi:DNA-dependent protein kinase catalytic subunit